MSAPLLDRARQILRPSLFWPGLPARDPEEFSSIENLAERLRAVVGAGEFELVPSRAAYPGFSDFHAVTVRAGGDYVATIADRWTSEAARDEAIARLRAALQRRAAA